MDPLVVFVVDDDDAVRDALVKLLGVDGLDARGFASAQAFLASLTPDLAGCLVLDVCLPDIDGLELQRVLAERGVDLPIVFLTGHGDIPMSSRAFRAGAFDFLEKPVRGDRFLAIVRAALARGAEQREARAERARLKARIEGLTCREREVMTHVVQGRSSKEIARELGVSHRTIEAHRARIMAKTRTRSLPALVELARACGMLDPDG